MMEYEAPEDHDFDGFVVEQKPASSGTIEEKKDKELNQSQKEVVSENVASMKSELNKMIVPGAPEAKTNLRKEPSL